MRCSRWLSSILTMSMSLGGCAFADELWEHGKGSHGKPHPRPPHPRPCEPECDAATHFSAADGSCIRKAVQLSVGIDYGCAVLSGGLLKCWGENSGRVLGYGDFEHRGDEPSEMGEALAPIDLGTGRTAVEGFADMDTTCAKLDDGTVKCWGYSGYGTPTGIPNMWSGEMGDALRTAPLPAGSVVAIGAGGGYGFALLADGALYGWGVNANAYTFVAGSGIVDFQRSSEYDARHYCGLRDDGAVLCVPWYGPTYGEVGWPLDPTVEGAYPPVLLGSGRTATAIALGDDHTCALLDDQTVKCWGRNQYGQLGYGDTVNRGLDTTAMGDALPVVPLGAPAVAITAGRGHTCALLEAGEVKCWGYNAAGELGLGDVANRGDGPGEVAALAPIPLGEAAIAIDAGTHTCALLTSGAVKCWGPNDAGELGLGDTEARGDQPGEVAALPPIDLGA